ncbi:DUF4433 domain-containing protein [Streptomyces sp. NPDC090298]|uniref:type II toxin-antitoxin system toxin DNA ADP-ribosyl transferase DarT n=1 Tax=Streptomyces sp. NPDC090298 TaxID=3365959 RepID=UPI00382F3C71
MLAPAQNRPIYHITHIRNLSDILTSQALLCESAVAQQGVSYMDIGMPSIKDRRRRTVVSCHPGGTPCDYVPFYFGPRSPMLYSIYRGNVPSYREGQDPVVYLVTTLASVRATGRTAVFTEGNAGAGFVDFHADDASLLEKTIDWDLMQERYWFDTPDDPARANRRQAEYLVHGSVPSGAIQNIVVRTEARAEQAREVIAEFGIDLPVVVYNGWYY